MVYLFKYIDVSVQIGFLLFFQFISFDIYKADKQAMLAHFSFFIFIVFFIEFFSKFISDERKDVQIKNKLNEDYLNAIFSSILSGVFVVRKKDLTIKSINNAALKMLGFEPDTDNARKFVFKHLCSEFMCNHCNCKCLEVENNFECILKKPDGTILPILKNTTFIVIGDEELIIHSFIDISAQKKAEKELIVSLEKAEELARSKQEFLANMSHEIRTPLNAIIGFSEICFDSETDKDKKDLLRIIMIQSQGLLQIINDILDMAKIESGKMILNEEIIEIKEAVNTAYEGLKSLADIKGIDLILDEGIENLPKYILCDRIKVSQILNNLIGNALKFTEKGSVVIKTLILDATKEIEFIISDTGIGIPQNKLEHIFEAFNQVDGSYTRKTGGTGLGLSIASKLLILMSGRIWVESKVGIGSDFHFTIPLYSIDDVIETKSINLRCTQIQSENKVILVAEDNDDNFKVLNHVLLSKGFKVLRACNGKDVFSILRYNKVDLIFMDMSMPDMSGLEATMYLKGDLLGPGFENIDRTIPIVGFSAHVFENDVEKFFEAGIDDFIGKPAKKDDICKILEKYFKKEG